MATSKEEFEKIAESLKAFPEISYRPMMGEYVLYFRQKVVGGIYDGRVLIKPVEGLNELIPEVRLELPYDGAKLMVLIDSFDEKFLRPIFEHLYKKLPEPKKRR